MTLDLPCAGVVDPALRSRARPVTMPQRSGVQADLVSVVIAVQFDLALVRDLVAGLVVYRPAVRSVPRAVTRWVRSTKPMNGTPPS